MSAKMLGRKLKALRTARTLNQTTLAKRARVTQPYIVALEKGRENPTLAVLERLARALKVPVAELISRMSRQPETNLKRHVFFSVICRTRRTRYRKTIRLASDTSSAPFWVQRIPSSSTSRLRSSGRCGSGRGPSLKNCRNSRLSNVMTSCIRNGWLVCQQRIRNYVIP